jgi:hypothetical protein
MQRLSINANLTLRHAWPMMMPRVDAKSSACVGSGKVMLLGEFEH